MSKLKTIVLKWKKYHSYKEVREDDYAWFDPTKPESNGKGIYLMADSKCVPLYIGRANGKWGFADRYNATGFLDAAIEHAGNLIYFAEVESRLLCKDIETQLIWEEQKCNKMVCKYNGIKAAPQRNVDIRHEGDVPNFIFMSNQSKAV